MALANDIPDLRLWHILNHLETSYWWDVDCNGGGQAHEFYMPDGLFAVGDNQFLGRQNIRAFYTWRRRRGFMTLRHMIYNFRVVSSAEYRASHAAVLGIIRHRAAHPSVARIPRT